MAATDVAVLEPDEESSTTQDFFAEDINSDDDEPQFLGRRDTLSFKLESFLEENEIETIQSSVERSKGIARAKSPFRWVVFLTISFTFGAR